MFAACKAAATLLQLQKHEEDAQRNSRVFLVSIKDNQNRTTSCGLDDDSDNDDDCISESAAMEAALQAAREIQSRGRRMPVQDAQIHRWSFCCAVISNRVLALTCAAEPQ
jgi:hypothetical protein